MKNCKIVYFVNHIAFFVSHRLPLALHAKEKGWDVLLLVGQADNDEIESAAVEILKQHDIKFVRVCFRSAGLNPVIEFVGLIQSAWRIFKFCPDILHTASPKAMIYGGIIARMLMVPSVVFAVSGMGFIFTNANKNISWTKRLLKNVYLFILRYILNHKRKVVIVQNADDRAFIERNSNGDGSAIVLIPGSGVDINHYSDIESIGSNVVVLPARMLVDKGVREFVGAAKKLKGKGCSWRFQLVGAAGFSNPSAINQIEIDEWVQAGYVEWLGNVSDIKTVYRHADIVCLPSYREGMPKALLEASAAAKPIVTTDVIGCREAIVDGKTGLLVKPYDIDELAEKLEILISDKKKRELFGSNGRELAISRFSIGSVVASTFKIYEGF